LAQKPRILVVEDERDAAEMMCAYLDSVGADVDIAPWGQDALQLCSQREYDLVLLDIKLPDMNGYEVFKRIRRMGSNAPIIFWTEKSDEISRLTGLELGAIDYIPKLFSIEELRLRVRNALKYRSLQLGGKLPDITSIHADSGTPLTLADIEASTLRKVLTERFDLEELRTLCAELDVNFDGLRGEGQEAKARELVAYLQRRDQLSKLTDYILYLRQDIKLS